MKRLWMALVLAAAVAAAQAQTAASAEAMLEAARKKELLSGDLDAAIRRYKEILSKYPRNRAAAAQALVRMGQCYEKLGDAEARKAYERAVREYGDQKEAVATAQARLAALGGSRSALSYRQVWAGPKVDINGTVSPDGRYLSNVDWDTGDLAVRDLVANTDRRLTNKGTWAQSAEFAEESAISRDGRQVAYAWYNGKDRYELRVASLQTSGFPQARRLLDREDVAWIAPYDWSPDGQWLAVVLQRKDRSGQVGLVSTQDGSLRVVRASVPTGGPRRMFFSPDGKYLGLDLYAPKSNGRDVLVLTVSDDSEAMAVAGPSEDTMMGWTPDGRRLLFASDRRGSTDLWAIPMADGKPQGIPELIRPDIAPLSLGVTVSGALYVGVQISNRDIQVASLDFNTGRLLSGPVQPIQTSIGSNIQPEWSPDGKYLAYVSARNRAGSDRVLAIRSVETGQVHEQRPGLRMFNNPRWAPDGRSFVTSGMDFEGGQGIYRIDAATGEANLIAMSPAGSTFQRPQWSLDGQRIFYLRFFQDTGEYALLDRDLASGTEREMIRRKFDGRPSASPDGRYLAARSIEASTKSSALLLVPTAGGEPRELLRVHAPQSIVGLPVWSADGRSVIVQRQLSDSENIRELWLVPLTGSQPRKLEIDGRSLTLAQSPPSVHPDGRRIAYLAGETKIEVWVLENFLPAAMAAAK